MLEERRREENAARKDDEGIDDSRLEAASDGRKTDVDAWQPGCLAACIPARGRRLDRRDAIRHPPALLRAWGLGSFESHDVVDLSPFFLFLCLILIRSSSISRYGSLFPAPG
jgi:hypothetical protein